MFLARSSLRHGLSIADGVWQHIKIIIGKYSLIVKKLALMRVRAIRRKKRQCIIMLSIHHCGFRQISISSNHFDMQHQVPVRHILFYPLVVVKPSIMKATKIKLPFGLNEKNILAHIADVESGKKCGCVCPSCRSPLIAAKGSKKQHHFKHAIINECESGLESAIHLAAKQIIMERKQVTLPECISIASTKDSRGIEHTEQETVVRNGKIVNFNSVREETELHGMKADILAVAGNKPLIIEIFYRHKVEDQKLMKIAKANISAIEINLSDLTSEDVRDWETFWSCINDPQRVLWLYNAKAHHSVYQKLENRLIVKIRALEKQYEQEEIKIQKQVQKQKEQLLQALNDLKALCSKEYIAQLNQKAETHPVWKYHSQYLPFSWHELPVFLNVDVPNGEWIFGCDRRIWQIAFYSYFIRRNGKPFSVRAVDNWLQTTGGCKIPSSAKTVAIYGRWYPQLVQAGISGKPPSSWETLGAYFTYLCELGVLEFSGPDRGFPGSFWFRVISKDFLNH